VGARAGKSNCFGSSERTPKSAGLSLSGLQGDGSRARLLTGSSSRPPNLDLWIENGPPTRDRETVKHVMRARILDEPSPAPLAEASIRRSAWRDPVKYAADRAVALVDHAAAAMRIVKVQQWLVTIACMRDTTGREIERHLSAMRGEFQIAAFNVCLALGADGQYHRTWESPRARKLATILIFFAYLCQRSKYHGVVVWMIRGIPKGALAVAVRMRSTRFGCEVLGDFAHLNTVYSLIDELCRSGLLIRPEKQFAASKCPSWCVGKPKPDPRRPGEMMQWAFNYYFLTVCPYVDGLEGRIVPAPRDTAAPKLTVDLVAELEQRNAAAAEHWTRPTAPASSSEPIERTDTRPELNFSNTRGAESPSKPSDELDQDQAHRPVGPQTGDAVARYTDQASRAYARYVELSSRAPPDDKTN